jgi:prolyl-tRNA synthetase
MPNGKVMENGSLNNLGQAYSKKFNIKFADENGKEKYVWQTCTGNGERYLASVISEHGDDSGLVIPPSIAPIQIAIVPIYSEKNKAIVMKKAEEIKVKLKDYRVEIDAREISPGKKFYDSELKGIPIRIELGEKEIKDKNITLSIRPTKTKIKIAEKDLVSEIEKNLDRVQAMLLENSKKRLNDAITEVAKINELAKIVNSGHIAKVYWCESGECFDKIKALGEGLDLFGSDLKKHKEGKCMVCGNKTSNIAYIGNSY